MNILTFDIEDWFHTHKNRHQFSGHIWKDLPSKVVVNTERILNILDELDLKATFFVLGWVAEYYPQLIKKIDERGHEIAAHSHWHHNPQLLSPDNFDKDLKLCLSHLQNLSGKKVVAYRAPGFNLKIKDNWAFDILADNGIEVDSSIQINITKKDAPFTINTGNNKIVEFPLITTMAGIPYSGGGYFRLLPQWVLDYYFEKRNYNLLYLHPRDLDARYPFSNLFSLYRNMLNKVNTGSCVDSFKKIVSQHNTYTMSDAVKIYLNKSSYII